MYSTLAFATSVAAGSEGASYAPRRESPAALVLGAFNALGTIMFAFGGHAILLEVQVRPASAALLLKPAPVTVTCTVHWLLESALRNELEGLVCRQSMAGSARFRSPWRQYDSWSSSSMPDRCSCLA